MSVLQVQILGRDVGMGSSLKYELQALFWYSVDSYYCYTLCDYKAPSRAFALDLFG